MGPKKKQEKMSLGTFLGDQSLGSWADEMDEMPMPEARSGYGGGERREYSSRSGYGGVSDYGDRSYGPRDALPLPTKPPYTAHLGNLSFDVTNGDIEDFFAACAVTNVRIVEDKLDRKPKGFGYVEFGTLEGLKKALELNSTQFQGRSVRISVAEPPKDRQDAREIGDWTRKGPLPDLPSTTQRRPSDRGGYRQFDAASDAGSERGTSRRGPPSFEQGDGKVRDFGNWERKGPLSPTAAPPASVPKGDEGPRRNDRSFDRSFERRDSPSWGEGQAQEGSRPPRRDIPDRLAVERAPTAAELDNQWRSKMQPDAPVKSQTPTPDVSTPSSPVTSAAPLPASRPRLNLQKRTVSEAPTGNQGPASASSDAKASPFGAARPIDTAGREKEIEEKRLAQRQKKEEEDKEREEKRLAERAEKAERAKTEKVAASPAPQENGKPATQQPKESNGKADTSAGGPPPGKNYEILRRVADQENGDGDTPEAELEAEEPINGTIGDDNNVKPQEVVRDIQNPGQSDATTAEVMEDEGWSTVTKPPKKGRGTTRAALAS